MRQAISVLLIVGIVCAGGGTAWAWLETADPELPPTGGEYISPAEFGPEFVGAHLAIVVQNIVYQALAVPPPTRTNVGPDEREDFQSTVTGLLDITFMGVPRGVFPVTLSGPSAWKAYNKVGNTTGTFDVEIVEAELSGDVFVPDVGNLAIVLRERSEEASIGETTITDIGGGLYHIDSFFDVFTEVSADGGITWMAATESVHIYLVPEPATLGLLIGGLVMLRYRRK